MIKEQEGAIIKLEKQISDNTEKAEFIYNKYQEISSFLEKLKELRSRGRLADAKKYKAVKEVNQKEKYVVVEI